MGEVPLAPLGPVKNSVKIKIRGVNDRAKRPAIAVSLGCHVEGLLLPHPDPSDTDSMIAGAKKRFCGATPNPDLDLISLLRAFVRRYLRRHFVPLSASTDVSFETWLESTNYPLWRKVELRACWAKLTDIYDRRNFRVSSFQKAEHYVAWKYPRAINARCDEAKCIFGPWFKAIENVVYKDPHFIKHIPVVDRPEYIKRMLYRIGAKYGASDFTSYEASFETIVMEAMEFELYDYMTSEVPGGPEFAALARDALGGENRCRFRDFEVKVNGVRMSGDMCTSLGNGWSNLMLNAFLAEYTGQEFSGVFEGDDGLLMFSRELPSDELYARLGFVVKMTPVEDICSASFCGMIFDIEDMITVSDPKKILALFGWTNARYVRAGRRKLLILLRSKAMCILASYPQAPILRALALYGLRITESVGPMDIVRTMNAKGVCVYDRERISYALRNYDKWLVGVGEPPMRTRLLVESEFGISVEEQLVIENQLNDMHSVQPLPFGEVLVAAPESWREFWNTYVREDGSERQGFLGTIRKIA